MQASPSRPRWHFGAALAVLAVTPAACAPLPGPSKPAIPPGPTTTRPVATTTTTTLPITPIVWTACEGDLQCGSLNVPLNYADPSGATIEIALARHLAEVPAHRIGSLVINPGGPGV